MSSYNTRWCETHGEWEQDVDDPYAECPQCVEEGTSPTQLRYKTTLAREAEIKKLMDEIERLRALVYSYPPTEFSPEGVTWKQEAERLRHRVLVQDAEIERRNEGISTEILRLRALLLEAENMWPNQGLNTESAQWYMRVSKALGRKP